MARAFALRPDFSATELRRLARCNNDAGQVIASARRGNVSARQPTPSKARTGAGLSFALR